MNQEFDDDEGHPPSRKTGWIGAVWLVLAGLGMVLFSPPSSLIVRGIGLIAILSGVALALKLLFARGSATGVDADGA